jgi:hypothetical protein
MATYTLQFPPESDPFAAEVPVFLSFRAANYSTFARRRTLSEIKRTAYADIRVPFPKAMATLNSQNYQAGGSLNIQAIEIGGISGVMESFRREIRAKEELASSFFSGGGVIRFDHMETILQPGARRTHNFIIDMIAKTKEQAEVANQIALTFQANVFPVANTASILTMLHPPLWSIEAIGGVIDITNVARYWDGAPLVSVLRTVDVNRAPILNTGFITSDYKPLAINIKLSFIELEPAMQVGDGTNRIFSRSDRIVEQSGFGGSVIVEV